MVIRLSRGRGAAAAACLLVCLAACKKNEEKKEGSSEPAQAQEHRESAAQLTAPALFSHIPADTPFVFASFEPIPRSYWKRVAPVVQVMLDGVPQTMGTDDPPSRFAMALLRDLKANLNEAGLKKLLGIGPDGRIAVYGIGIVPVMRMELADAKALLATIERLQSESGLALPTASVGGRSYWRFGDDDVLVVAAVTGDQLVVSAGPTAMVEKALPFIVGVEQPTPNMADGGPLKQVAAQHGFAGYGVGYVDAQNLLRLLVMANFFRSAGTADALPPACMGELTALAKRFPRLAFGYDEFSDRKLAARMVFETDAALAARLKQLPVEVPGLVGGQLADPALFAFGLGVDVEKARQLVLDATDGIGRLGTACGGDMAEEMASVRATLSQPLPPGLDKIRGALVAVLKADLGPDGKPSGVEAYGILATDDPPALLELVKKQVPAGKMPEVAADGQFHEILPAGAMPGLDAIRAAIKPRAVVAVMGPKGPEAAERALARTGASPLFYVAYDYGQLMDKIMTQAAPDGPGAGAKAALSLFGMVSMWAYPTDQGLALAMSMELK